MNINNYSGNFVDSINDVDSCINANGIEKDLYDLDITIDCWESSVRPPKPKPKVETDAGCSLFCEVVIVTKICVTKGGCKG